MKTKDLIELLERNGWQFKRHGANHDIYIKGTERESKHKFFAAPATGAYSKVKFNQPQVKLI